jgi:hypothetical protein
VDFGGIYGFKNLCKKIGSGLDSDESGCIVPYSATQPGERR